MSINLEQFHQTFFEESFEGLDSMESGLLNLQAGGMDADTINTIFRAAHSIKGGSGTFGFNDVAKFTHVLETLLNEMRDGRRAVTPDAVNLLLQSVDVLREMLTAVRGKDAVNHARVNEVHGQLEHMLQAGATSSAAAPQAAAAHTRAPGTQDWKISFRPQPHLLKTGNDPLRIFRELGEHGSIRIDADLSQLPAFDKLDPESCYLGWNLVLESMAAESTINEAFDWVRDESALEISRESTEGSRESRVESRESTPTVSLTHDSRLSTHRNGAKARTAGRPRPPPKAPPSASTSARSMSSSTWSASWSLPRTSSARSARTSI